MRARLVAAVTIVIVTLGGVTAVLVTSLDDGSDRRIPLSEAFPTVAPNLLEFEILDDVTDFREQVAERRRQCDELRSKIRSDLTSPRQPASLSKSVTRVGINLRVPDELDLSPEGEAAAVQWFFSAAIGPIDRDVGLRLSVGIFASSSDYPILSLLDEWSTTRIPGTPVRTVNDVFRAYDLERSLTTFDCDISPSAPAQPLDVNRMRIHASISDDYGGQPYLHQEALLELSDHRLVQIMLDGLPNVTWRNQASIFEAIIESIRF